MSVEEMFTHTDGKKRSLLGKYDYPTSHRLVEIGALVLFVILTGEVSDRVGREVLDRWSWPTIAAVVVEFALGYATADFFSGLVHFLFDNFGSPSTPILGQKFIKPFRDHHDDPSGMTRGDVVAVNADNCLACLPVLVPVFFLLDLNQHPYVGVFVVTVSFFTMLTNQLHKWAHMDQRPPIVALLQRANLVLSVDHHRVHHTAPFDSNYCITWGILNPLLERIGFWTLLLRVLRRRA